MMDDENRGFSSLVLLVGLGVMAGSIVSGIGNAIPDGRILLLGVIVIVSSILVWIVFWLKGDGRDDHWVIEPSSPRDAQGRPDPSDADGLDDGPGICTACGGTLHYGRLHCPHCSESIFQGAGEEARPPEF